MTGSSNNGSGPSPPIFRVRAVLFQEGDLWVGQCVEYDIGAQARTLSELHRKLELTVVLDMQESLKRHGVAFEGIPPAPERFVDMWNNQSGEFRPAVSAAHAPSAEVGLELALCA